MSVKSTLIFCAALSPIVYGQDVISTQGASYSNASGSIDFTIGETIIATGSDGSNDITQGFHQTNWNFVGIEDHQENMEANVFPNPMNSSLTIQTPDFDDVQFKMLDAQGRLVATGTLEEEQSQIETASFVPGNYTLMLYRGSEKLKTFKLIKQH